MPHHVTGISNSGERESLIILDHMSCKLPCLRDIWSPLLYSAQTKACHPPPSANHWKDTVNVTAENKDTEICRGGDARGDRVFAKAMAFMFAYKARGFMLVCLICF